MNKITLIEVGITFLDLLRQVENDKIYDLIANELALTYKYLTDYSLFKLIGISYEIPQEVQKRDRYATTY